MIESPGFLIIDKERSMVSISGNDHIEFLQGLITNDVLKLDEGILYSAILSPQGKYHFDFFIVENQTNSFLLIYNQIKKVSFWSF